MDDYEKLARSYAEAIGRSKTKEEAEFFMNEMKKHAAMLQQKKDDSAKFYIQPSQIGQPVMQPAVYNPALHSPPWVNPPPKVVIGAAWRNKMPPRLAVAYALGLMGNGQAASEWVAEMDARNFINGEPITPMSGALIAHGLRKITSQFFLPDPLDAMLIRAHEAYMIEEETHELLIQIPRSTTGAWANKAFVARIKLDRLLDEQVLPMTAATNTSARMPRLPFHARLIQDGQEDQIVEGHLQDNEIPGSAWNTTVMPSVTADPFANFYGGVARSGMLGQPIAVTTAASPLTSGPAPTTGGKSR